MKFKVICIFEKDSPWTVGGILSLTPYRFEREWSGRDIEFEASFVLAVDPARLHLAVRCSLSGDGDDFKPGSFHANLWKRDVGELFLCDPQTGHYQEWNVSPAGAWWTNRLLSPRHTDPDFRADTETSTAKPISSPWGWGALLSIPRPEQLERLRGNVTMIAGSGHDERFFLSTCPQPGQPDFHNPDRYLPLHLVQAYPA